MLEEDEEYFNDYMRRIYVKFYVNIYKSPFVSDNTLDSGEYYLIDINLFKGSPLVFLNLA